MRSSKLRANGPPLGIDRRAISPEGAPEVAATREASPNLITFNKRPRTCYFFFLSSSFCNCIARAFHAPPIPPITFFTVTIAPVGSGGGGSGSGGT
jgi:hypothetical protein